MHDEQNSIGKPIALTVTVIAVVLVMLLAFWNQAGGADTTPKEHDVNGKRAMADQKPKIDAAGFAIDTAQEHDPSNPMLLTVPKLSNLNNSEVVTASGDDKEALKNYAGVHLAGTGFPWQKGANVYIAGHRMGFPGTPSDKTFYHLEKLKKGDSIILSEKNGTSYLYRVYDIEEVGPNDVDVTLPVPGKSIVSLQTCTLPDYTRRVVVRAEMVSQ